MKSARNLLQLVKRIIFSHASSIIIAAIVMLLWFIHTPHHIFFEQDNYWEYARALLKKAPFVLVDTRLFPGTGIFYAVLELIISNKFIVGPIISFLLFLGSYKILRSFTNSTLSFFILAFPPVVLRSFALISSESLFIFILLGSFFLWKKNNKNLSYLLLGALLWVRLIAVVIIFIRLLLDLKEKNFKQFFTGILIIGVSSIALLIYNQLIFRTFFVQFLVYPSAGHATIAALQFVQDIFRAWNWKQYQIFFSGIGYFFLTGFYFFIAAKKRQQNSLTQYIFWSAVAMTVFVFSIGPTPFLEEYPRFLVPVFVSLGLLLPSVPRKIIVPLIALAIVSILL